MWAEENETHRDTTAAAAIEGSIVKASFAGGMKRKGRGKEKERILN